MWALLRGLVGGVTFRAVAAAAVTVSIAAGSWALYHTIWEKGYDAAVAKYQAAKLQEIEEAVAAARKTWEESAAVADEVLENERKLAEVSDALRNQVPGVVASAPCSRVGPDFLRLFNDAVTGSGAGSEAPSPAGTAPRMP